MQPFIVQGDRTSHGGTVLNGSPWSDCDGKPIARMRDMVACPKCRGVFPIVQGDQSSIMDGAPVAYHGCKTGCGASLISSQIRTLTEPSSGAAVGAASAAMERFGAVGAGMAAGYEEEALGGADGRFQGRFQLVSIDEAAPISGQLVRVRSGDAEWFTTTTDADGYTQWVEREAAESLAFEIVEQEA